MTAFPLEARVILHGLVKAPDLNGRTGVIKSEATGGRQQVHLEDLNKNVALKVDNLKYEGREIATLSVKELKLLLKLKNVPDTELVGADKKELKTKLTDMAISSEEISQILAIAKAPKPSAPAAAKTTFNGQASQAADQLSNMSPERMRQQAQMMRSMDPNQIRRMNPQMAHMSDAQLQQAATQMEMMANNPDMMKAAAEQMKNMSPQELQRMQATGGAAAPANTAQRADQLSNMSPEQMRQKAQMMKSMPPDQIRRMNPQMAHMSDAQLQQAATQWEMMANNPDMMKAAAEEMKNMNPQDMQQELQRMQATGGAPAAGAPAAGAQPNAQSNANMMANMTPEQLRQQAEMMKSMPPDQIRRMNPQLAHMTDAQIQMAANQFQMMADNPDMMKMAMDQMKNMSPDDIAKLQQQTGSTPENPPDLANMGDPAKMLENMDPKQLKQMMTTLKQNPEMLKQFAAMSGMPEEKLAQGLEMFAGLSDDKMESALKVMQKAQKAKDMWTNGNAKTGGHLMKIVIVVGITLVYLMVQRFWFGGAVAAATVSTPLAQQTVPEAVPVMADEFAEEF